MGLRARTRSCLVPLSGTGTLMAQALAAGLPVASSCSGRGACGRCLVSVLEGEAFLSRLEPHEREVLARNGVLPGARLSCQTRLLDAAGEVTITTGYW